MRKFLVLVAVLSGVGARAEQFFECRLTAQSDSVSVFGVPKKVHLEESRVWYLREDGRAQKGFRVKEAGPSVHVSYTRSTGATIIESRYTFNRSRCDNEGTGSAVLSRKAIGAADSAGPSASTSLYKCECGVD